MTQEIEDSLKRMPLRRPGAGLDERMAALFARGMEDGGAELNGTRAALALVRDDETAAMATSPSASAAPSQEPQDVGYMAGHSLYLRLPQPIRYAAAVAAMVTAFLMGWMTQLPMDPAHPTVVATEATEFAGLNAGFENWSQWGEIRGGGLIERGAGRPDFAGRPGLTFVGQGSMSVPMRRVEQIRVLNEDDGVELHWILPQEDAVTVRPMEHW